MQFLVLFLTLLIILSSARPFYLARLTLARLRPWSLAITPREVFAFDNFTKSIPNLRYDLLRPFDFPTKVVYCPFTSKLAIVLIKLPSFLSPRFKLSHRYIIEGLKDRRSVWTICWAEYWVPTLSRKTAIWGRWSSKGHTRAVALLKFSKGPNASHWQR